jgi:hypothetical protein
MSTLGVHHIKRRIGCAMSKYISLGLEHTPSHAARHVLFLDLPKDDLSTCLITSMLRVFLGAIKTGRVNITTTSGGWTQGSEIGGPVHVLQRIDKAARLAMSVSTEVWPSYWELSVSALSRWHVTLVNVSCRQFVPTCISV